ncbi:MAG: PEP-CTERM sorting domain-containing protein [Acidobacteriota bacterium]|jgi:hypothetical protein|nr:PEP-CTERM sorting domain-containing protein [Acidobacteriota bacterium]
MKKRIFAFAAVGMLLFTAAAVADTVTIDAITGEWSNAIDEFGQPRPEWIYNGLSNPGDVSGIVEWGESAFEWYSAITPLLVPTGMPFRLGTFSHINMPMDESAVTLGSVNLNLSIGNFENPSTINTTVQFSLDATMDNLNPCPYPTYGRYGCSDLVTISDFFYDEQITDNGGNLYYLSLLGFSNDEGNTFTYSYVTQEYMAGNPRLYAIVTNEPLSPATVPEPASMLLLSAGLGGVCLTIWRKKKK